MEEILCRYAKALHNKEGSDYKILLYEVCKGEIPEQAFDKMGRITCLGEKLPTNPYIQIRCIGEWKNNEYKGVITKQFHVSSFQEIIPEDEDGFYQYLASGSIPGIGVKMAERIMDTLGPEAYQIIQNEPDSSLKKVKGLPQKKIDIIKKILFKNASINPILESLKYEISENEAEMIYQAFGTKALDRIKKSIFTLYEAGFDYWKLVSLAKKLHRFIPEDPERIQACAIMKMKEAVKKGHTYISSDDLFRATKKALKSHGSVKDLLIHQQLEFLASIDCFSCEFCDNKYYLPSYYNAEKYIAKMVIHYMKEEKADISDDLLKKKIDEYSRKSCLILSKEQREAAIASQKERLLIITGGPGTGKTTTINYVLYLSELFQSEKKIKLLAPTARAARRMTEGTGYEASTIHSACQIFDLDDFQEFQANGIIDADIVIVDEMSMVDCLLFRCLLQSLKEDAQLILVGDPDQLPSVKAGNVFADLINSNIIPVIRLKQVFRQGVDSFIPINAKLINEGNPNVIFNRKDFKMIEITGEDMDSITASAVASVYQDEMNCYSVDDIQVLTPFRKENGAYGQRKTSVEYLNRALQQLANSNTSASSGKLSMKNKTFYKMDKVMETRTKKGLCISNGDIGRVISIDEESKTMEILFNGLCSTYTFKDLFSLDLAYATTIHKSQGSEYPIVIIPLLKEFRGMLTRQLLYTAVTRASKRVIFLGEKSAFYAAVRNDNSIIRNTSLKDRLICEYREYLSQVRDEIKPNDHPEEDENSFEQMTFSFIEEEKK